MSEESKGTTQTAPPADTSSAHRKLSAKEQAWEKNTLQPTLEKNPERQAEFTTISGYPIRRLYTQADLPNWDPDRALGFPGEPPYTRGIHSTMHRGRLWTMRQFAGFGAAEDTNQRFRYLLAQGQTGLSTAFDLPTLMGYDSDHALSEGEVGKCGVAITSAKPARPPYRNWPSPCATASSTSNGGCAAASTWTSLFHSCPSSSTRTTISSRRSPSTAQLAASGTKPWSSATSPRIRVPGPCVSTRRPPAVL